MVEDNKDNQTIKQNGQLIILQMNLINLLSVYLDNSNKKSGKYLSGLLLINNV
jgi:hypothetical protein